MDERAPQPAEGSAAGASATRPGPDVGPRPRHGLRSRLEHAFRPWRRANRMARVLVVVGLLVTLFFGALAVFADTIAPYGPQQYCTEFDPETGACGRGSEQLPRREEPSGAYPFGTTSARLDVLSRVVHGASAAFQVLVFSTMFAMLIGVPLGLFSGYIGGRFDRILVMGMDTVYALPSLLLALLIAFVFAAEPNESAPALIYWIQRGMQRFLSVVEFFGVSREYVPAAASVGVVYIPQYYRVIRNHTLSVKEEPFVEAARSLGAKPRIVVFRYVFFNVVQSVPVLFTLNAADGILTLAGLGFLGIGVVYPAAEWGVDVSRGLSDTVAGFWWTAFWPGMAITVLVTGLTLLGEGLNDIINPLLRVKGYRGRVRGGKGGAPEAVGGLAGAAEPAPDAGDPGHDAPAALTGAAGAADTSVDRRGTS